jgi:hypothetical protein
MLAPETHGYLDKIAEAKDAGDLVDIRKQLGRVVREGSGEDVAAAAIAKEFMHGVLDRHLPAGGVDALKSADVNYAIAHKVEKYQNALDNTLKKGENRGSGGNTANRIRQAIEPLTLAGKEKFVSPQVKQAAEAVTQPGAAIDWARRLGHLDPTRHGLMMALTAIASPLHFLTGGVSAIPHLGLGVGGAVARRLGERALKSRAQNVVNTIAGEAPASLASGYVAPQLGHIYRRPMVPSLAFNQQQQP